MKPLSEELKIVAQGKIIINHDEVFERAITFDLVGGEMIDASFDIELHDQATCEMNIFVRGQGTLTVHRTTNVLGSDSVIRFRVSGETLGEANVSWADDVCVSGERANLDLCTKFVLRDEAKSVVRQRVTLLPSATGSMARQRIDHLMLGDHARAEGIPELDVQLDDITCSHAATISQPSEEAKFYLLSRGMSVTDAERLLVHGFLS